jgi:hypothetical protein
MANKNVALTSLFLGVDVFSFGNLLLMAIRWIGRIEWLQGLPAVIPLFEYQSINWPGVYLLAVCISTSALVYMHGDFLFLCCLAIIRKVHKDYHATDIEIVNYIASSSIYGATFQPERRLEGACRCFLEMLRNGKLAAMVRQAGYASVVRVKPKDFRNIDYNIKTVSPPHGYIQIKSSIIDLTTESEIYEIILCDWRQVKKIWPPKAA